MRRTAARIEGAQAARKALERAGADIKASRRRRRLTQRALGRQIGVSQAQIAAIEAGQATGAPLETWFALGVALNRPFRVELMRDQLALPVDGGHLDIQELVLRVCREAGYTGHFELATRPSDPSRSADAMLLDRRGRRLVIAECWNTFGDLGAAARSSERKLAEARQLAIVLAGDGLPLQVGLVWVVRDTRANRGLIERYPHIFASRLPGSSRAWTRALMTDAALPTDPGLVWSDLRATRICARRPGRQGQRQRSTTLLTPDARPESR
jgi:transcriptional regulator with XRE-family HTH domain